MATEHIVKQGEHLSGIAAKYGFGDYRSIWNHPANAELKQKRPNPHVLMPGDQVHIPDRTTGEKFCSTGSHNRFVVSQQPLKLRLVLRDFDDRPVANTDCELEIGSVVHALTTNEDGLIEVEIPRSADGGNLSVPALGLNLPVRIGNLDPVEEEAGWQARLINLGYHSGPLDDSFQDAIEEFQCDHHLKVSGLLDTDTSDKLLELHGC